MRAFCVTCIFLLLCSPLTAGEHAVFFGGTVWQVIDGNSLIYYNGGEHIHVTGINTGRLYGGCPLPRNTRGGAVVLEANGVFPNFIYSNTFSRNRTIKSYRYVPSRRVVEVGRLPRMTACPSCRGSGSVRVWRSSVACRRCRGSGVVSIPSRDKVIVIDALK